MSTGALLPALTAALSFLFALALVDQWRERRHGFQLAWAAGILFLGIGAACEAIAAESGWSWNLLRAWYLTGAVWTAGWLGLGTAFLLGRTRFGYTVAVVTFFAGLITLLTGRKYPDAAGLPLGFFLFGLVITLAIGVETYFANSRWPRIALLGVGAPTLLSIVLAATAPLPAAGIGVAPTSGLPLLGGLPSPLRLLVPFMNISGAMALVLGAVFSTYEFMPKRRVLAYSLDPAQEGDQFLFNLLIAPVAIAVNLVASLPGALRALLAGRLHTRVPATILIAAGGFLPAVGDEAMARLGDASYHQLGLLLGVVLLFSGFLVSTEVFRAVRIPFTRITLRTRHDEAV